MLVGGAPASTAGGMKVTTLAILVASMHSVFRRHESVSLFRRRMTGEVVKSASAILVLYFILFSSCGITICLVEGIDISKSLFEAASAVGTVGLSLGITPSLGAISKCFLMVLMFFGRVGGLTLIYATAGKVVGDASKYPVDQLTVG